MSDFFRKENINVYVIDKDTKIYRGDKSDVNPQDKLSKEYLFFTPKMDQAKQYGIVSEFETNKPLRVVALDDITVYFFNSAPEDVKKYLVSNWVVIFDKVLVLVHGTEALLVHCTSHVDLHIECSATRSTRSRI